MTAVCSRPKSNLSVAPPVCSVTASSWLYRLRCALLPRPARRQRSPTATARTQAPPAPRLVCIDYVGCFSHNWHAASALARSTMRPPNPCCVLSSHLPVKLTRAKASAAMTAPSRCHQPHYTTPADSSAASTVCSLLALFRRSTRPMWARKSSDYAASSVSIPSCVSAMTGMSTPTVLLCRCEIWPHAVVPRPFFATGISPAIAPLCSGDERLGHFAPFQRI